MEFNKFKRVRRLAPNPEFAIRLHRGEYGSKVRSKVYDKDNYYPDPSKLISTLSYYLRTTK